MHKISELKYQQSILLHASSVNILGNAILFLGHSSSGKSTICELLSQKYPIISDDKVKIFQKRNQQWFICDGDETFNSKEINLSLSEYYQEYPLFAMLRIFKSIKTDIHPISPIKTCQYLIDAVFEVDKQRKQDDIITIKKWFAQVAIIAKQIPGWILTFEKDISIIKKVQEKFEKDIFHLNDNERKHNV